MKNSNIEWCDHTFNAWEGCTMITPGCANCYAENRNQRFHGGANWGPGAPRLLRSDDYWEEPLKWDKEAAKRQDELTARRKAIGAKDGPEWHARRPRVFCSSLADWLDEEGPIDQLARLMALIHDTPNSDWLLLTKRPQNWRDKVAAAMMTFEDERRHPNKDEEANILAACGKVSVKRFKEIIAPFKRDDVSLWLGHWLEGKAPHNVWIGTTVEDQRRADERIPELLKIPARVRFLSCEPLLGPLEFSDVTNRKDCAAVVGLPVLTGINWVICGGESGPRARPMHPDWARSLRDQCQSAGVPFLFKQWGEWCPRGPESLGYPCVDGVPRIRLTDAGGNGSDLSASGGNDCWMNRAGKKSAGRLLDGREWNEFPEVAK